MMYILQLGKTFHTSCRRHNDPFLWVFVCPWLNFGVLSTARPIPAALLLEGDSPQATGTALQWLWMWKYENNQVGMILKCNLHSRVPSWKQVEATLYEIWPKMEPLFGFLSFPFILLPLPLLEPPPSSPSSSPTLPWEQVLNKSLARKSPSHGLLLRIMT